MRNELTLRGRVFVMHTAQATPRRPLSWKRRAADFGFGLVAGFAVALALIGMLA